MRLLAMALVLAGRRVRRGAEPPPGPRPSGPLPAEPGTASAFLRARSPRGRQTTRGGRASIRRRKKGGRTCSRSGGFRAAARDRRRSARRRRRNARVVGKCPGGYRIENSSSRSCPSARHPLLYVPKVRATSAVLVPCGHSPRQPSRTTRTARTARSPRLLRPRWDPVGQGDRSLSGTRRAGAAATPRVRQHPCLEPGLPGRQTLTATRSGRQRASTTCSRARKLTARASPSPAQRGGCSRSAGRPRRALAWARPRLRDRAPHAHGNRIFDDPTATPSGPLAWWPPGSTMPACSSSCIRAP